MAARAETSDGEDPAEHYARVRALSVGLALPLSDADATIQPCPDASPAKWHLAHTTWFFETFVLRDHLPGYALYDAAWPFLFNSYYDGEGARHARAKRGMLSRPSLDQIKDYRTRIDLKLMAAIDRLPAALIELGLHHEQQHQELMLMDLTAAMAENPLQPAVWAPDPPRGPVPLRDAEMIARPGGLVDIGAPETGFAFDCERPRHKVHLAPYRIADRPVLNREWLNFIEDGGYTNPGLWLSDGWAWVQAEGARAPLYWSQSGEGWTRFGLDGRRPVDPDEPVCHISYYEADAYARWAGARLPTETEWEDAASALDDPSHADLLDRAGPARPRPPALKASPSFYGGVWQWTASAYLPYSGFRAAEGTVGEYNGKFMSGQMVLRGGCSATPRGHVRPSYRNFFYPQQRWMFAGLRLAEDA